MLLCHWDRKKQMELHSIWGRLVPLAFSWGCCDGISTLTIFILHFHFHGPSNESNGHFMRHIPCSSIFQFTSSPIFQFSSPVLPFSSSPVLPFFSSPIHWSVVLV